MRGRFAIARVPTNGTLVERVAGRNRFSAIRPSTPTDKGKIPEKEPWLLAAFALHRWEFRQRREGEREEREGSPTSFTNIAGLELGVPHRSVDESCFHFSSGADRRPCPERERALTAASLPLPSPPRKSEIPLGMRSRNPAGPVLSPVRREGNKQPERERGGPPLKRAIHYSTTAETSATSWLNGAERRAKAGSLRSRLELCLMTAPC